MAFLPQELMTLTGGCFCKAIRYTVKMPALEDRPLVPEALPTPIGPSDDGGNTVPTRFPLVDLDHCDSCRRVSAAIIQCWLICPADWVEWSLTPRTGSRSEESGEGGLGHKDSDGENSRPDKTAGQGGDRIHISTLAAVSSQPRLEGEARGDSAPVARGDTYLARFHSSPDVTRTFCARCGTNLTFFYDRPPSRRVPPVVDITVGSLDPDSLNRIRPDRHGWWEDGINWVKELLRKGDGGFLIRHPTGAVNRAVT